MASSGCQDSKLMTRARRHAATRGAQGVGPEDIACALLDDREVVRLLGERAVVRLRNAFDAGLPAGRPLTDGDPELPLQPGILTLLLRAAARARHAGQSTVRDEHVFCELLVTGPHAVRRAFTDAGVSAQTVMWRLDGGPGGLGASREPRGGVDPETN